MDQVLDHVAGARVPVHIGCLVRPQRVECFDEILAQRAIKKLIRLDDAVFGSVKRGDEPGLVKMLSFAPKLGNTL